ncbi:hypothetical protein, partial [Streptomyces sp. NPDC090080]|uniref:hypothetical protein n=1 Tax=Streptomyces sp. NPDC090080 TaxID=3365939 RepID=UPI0038162597
KPHNQAKTHNTPGQHPYTPVRTTPGTQHCSHIDVDSKCTTSHKGLFEGSYEIRVCTVKTGGRPVNCSVTHKFTV